MKTLIGQIISNRYKIKERLGGGGMALVFKGIDLLLSRTVTIKILREQLASDQDVVRRFQKEAQAVAKLSHPNIVSIYDVGQEEELYYLVMEYIDGRNLKEIILESGPFEIEKTIDISIQICDALQHAHDNNIIHRDIKPQNILVTKDGKVKVTDFGIAQAATNATMTYSGDSIIGTVQYISPEQARGKVSTIHTDIYSAGIVLYEMATNNLPFEGDTAIGIALQHIQAEYRPPTELVPEIPIELEKIIKKALSKNPQDRFENALAMKRALENVKTNGTKKLDDTQVLTPVEGFNQRELIKKANGKNTNSRTRLIGVISLILAVLLLPTLAYLGFQQYLKVAEVEVPDVINMTLAEAELNLLKAGLEWEEGKRRHDEEIPLNHILSQQPQGGEKIKKTRKVILDISLGQQLEKVPDVIGFSEREGLVEIENAGFVVSEQLTRRHDAELPEGYILDQNPRPNQMVVIGSPIELTISLGPKPNYISMPNLIGRNLEEVRQIFAENDLEIGDTDYEVSHKYFSGQVIEQGIPAGEEVLQRTAIDLKFSLGPGPEPKRAAVQLKVKDGENKRLIKIVVEDSSGEHEEYSAIHNPDDFISVEVPYFGQGSVKVYDDGVLIDEAELI